MYLPPNDYPKKDDPTNDLVRIKYNCEHHTTKQVSDSEYYFGQGDYQIFPHCLAGKMQQWHPEGTSIYKSYCPIYCPYYQGVVTVQ